MDADARVFAPDTHLHFMTILLYNKPNISSLSHFDTYPPFLPSLISSLCVKFVVWICSALSEKLLTAKYSKIYLAPEITWYWLASQLQVSSRFIIIPDANSCKAARRGMPASDLLSQAQHFHKRDILWMTLSSITLPVIAWCPEAAWWCENTTT